MGSKSGCRVVTSTPINSSVRDTSRNISERGGRDESPLYILVSLVFGTHILFVILFLPWTYYLLDIFFFNFCAGYTYVLRPGAAAFLLAWLVRPAFSRLPLSVFSVLASSSS